MTPFITNGGRCKVVMISILRKGESCAMTTAFVTNIKRPRRGMNEFFIIFNLESAELFESVMDLKKSIVQRDVYCQKI